MKIRPATTNDANGMAAVLAEIIDIWKSDRPTSAAHVQNFYIQDKSILQTTVAQEDDGSIIGFQVLKLAAAGNIYGVTPGWGIIGTYVKPGLGRHGIGSAMFAKTLLAAKNANLKNIDATIGRDNADGLAYYGACGFQAYRETEKSICKRFQVAGCTN